MKKPFTVPHSLLEVPEERPGKGAGGRETDETQARGRERDDGRLPDAIDPERFRQLKVDLTIFDGRVIFDRTRPN